MKTLSRFVTKFTSLIVAVLSCFDRVIFKGHLALAAPCELERFVDYVLKVRRYRLHEDLRSAVLRPLGRPCPGLGAEGRPHYEYRTGQFRKDEWAQKLIREQGISEGLVGILCTHGNLPLLRTRAGPQAAPVRQPTPAATGPLLLLPRSPVRPDPRPLADLVAVHRPGLRQWPRMAGPADGAEEAGLRAAAQRLHPTRRPRPGPTPGRPLRPAQLAEDPQPLGTTGQSVAPRTVPRLPRALGRRSGRVRHRPAVHQPRGVGRPVPRAAGLMRC